ncbi:MAG: polyprenyl diphosphate synthase, partial [Gammaproteobacteria bacterium]
MTESTANITVPEHVAIVMDGNGRWAIKRNKKRMQGHKAGMDVARGVLEDCARAGVKILTLFAFSSENWKRPHEEVSYLMRLFVEGLTREANKLLENNIRMKVIGDHGRFPEKLQQAITKAELLTKDCDAMHLNIAANYGGRWDITQAAKTLISEVQAGQLAIDDIDENVFHQHTIVSELP